ncbi:MAG TPA: TonB-dependent receptor [Sphingomicrobium sp.]|nr:TonB-dependent receptor [Sphingomicrobium sp.]
MRIHARGLLSTSAAAALIAATPVPAYAQAQTFNFDIPSQPLDASLRAFARASRQQIMFDGELVKGRTAPELKGSYTADAAVAHLLAGSGLSASRTNGGSWVVSKGTSQGNALAGAPNAGTETASSRGEDNQDIVVFGFRSARTEAIKQEQAADGVSTVVSSDLLGNFQGTTISEALRKASGISFVPDITTGDGVNIIIRGLEPDMNTVKFNGVQLPVGNGTGRSPDLSNILADSVERITISKTLLPSQESGGTGGLVEIVTKSPLDRPRQYANAAIEYGTPGKKFGQDFLISGTLSHRFGKGENFGLSASVQYRNRHANSFQALNSQLLFGEFLPLDDAGGTLVNSLINVDPTRIFPFEPSASKVYALNLNTAFADVKTKALGVTLAAEWQVAESTNLNLTYQLSKTDVAQFAGSTGLTSISDYEERPVEALAGETRRAITYFDLVNASQFYRFAPSDVARSDVLSFHGKTDVGALKLGYNLGFTKGSMKSQGVQQFSVRSLGFPVTGTGFLQPEAFDPVEGQVLTIFGPHRGDGVQLPLLTDAGYDLLNNPSLYAISQATQQSTFGSNRRLTGGLDATYLFDGSVLKDVAAGVHYEAAKFKNSVSDVDLATGSATLSSLGADFDEATLETIGFPPGLRIFSLDALIPIGAVIFSGNPPAGLSTRVLTTNPLLGDASTKEVELAAYLQARMQFGGLELIGGARLTRVRLSAFNFHGASIVDEDGTQDVAFNEAHRNVIGENATFTTILPRILMNYRRGTNLVLRAGYFQTVARPQIGQLSAAEDISLILIPENGPSFDQPLLFIERGNPDLKPSIAHNFDASAELYRSNASAIKVGAFYKIIKNPIQGNVTSAASSLEGVTLPNDPRFQNLPQNIFISFFRPINDPVNAKLWGIEASVEQQLNFLPGLLGGLGIYANYTYTKSSRHFSRDWRRRVFDNGGNFVGNNVETAHFFDVALDSQPPHSGTLALTYNKYGFDGMVSYTYQSRRRSFFQAHGLSQYDEAIDSLDARLEYLFKVKPAQIRLFVEGANLLKGNHDPSLERSRGGESGSPKIIYGGTYLGGRSIKAGVSATF